MGELERGLHGKVLIDLCKRNDEKHRLHESICFYRSLEITEDFLNG